jgi:hypothetical protein
MATSTAPEEVSDSGGSDCAPTRKPFLPYRKGVKITAMQHEPPEPFGMWYSTERRPSPEGWEKMSQLDYCISCPPLEGATEPSICKSLTITSTIRTGRHQGAQIVVVDHTMVAKIYDPLYYSFYNDCGTKDDVVWDADSDYTCEAACFRKLQESAEARAVIPAYYGTWTMNVKTPVKVSRYKKLLYTRPVRFILMERLRGDCMDDIDPFDMRKRVRSMILKKVIVAETLLWDAGVNHQDLSPRNIMISGASYDDPNIPISDIKLEVKIFDFNVASVLTHPQYVQYYKGEKPRKKKWPSKLRSPIIRYHGHMMEFSTVGWCSNKDDEPEKWLWNEFSNDNRYIPVIWDPNNTRKRPIYQTPTDAQQISVSDTNPIVSASHSLLKAGDSSDGSSEVGSEGNNKTEVESVNVEPEKDLSTREDSVIKGQV